MSKGKQSTFLKGQKGTNRGRSENRVSARTVQGRRSDMPNSTKVGQGEGIASRGYDVAERRAVQSGKNKPNGLRSNLDVSIKKKEVENEQGN